MVLPSNYFSEKELNCQHTGKEGTDPDALALLNALRIILGRPLIITSAYRAPEHPIEAAKEKPGRHSEGHAFDVWYGDDEDLRDKIIHVAETLGFNGIGVHSDFVHIDRRPNRARWTYS